VLVVDDSLTAREAWRQLLAAQGCVVEVAVDGVDAWNILQTAAFDLMVTDVDMPRLDGLELVGLIRGDARLRTLRVVVVSHKDRAEDKQRGLAAGADEYLTKSGFQDEVLVETVGRLLGADRR
jgi:two-component system sensor histidine kinase and response regulator WspE